MKDNDPKTETPVSLEVLTPSSLGELERAHIDSQVSTAHAYPRSLAIFQKRALEMVTLDEETAESCIYSRPVGKQKNEQTGQWEMKFAEGNSVRLSEIVAACYGNIRVSCRVVEQTERFVKCEGVAHDLESNYAAKSEVMESTLTRDGQPFSERMRIVVAKACLSKARRDALFQVVPKALCKKISDAAKKVATGDETTLENRRKRVGEWLKSINIDDARLFATLGVNGWAEIGLKEIETLTGLKTAMKDGDTTKDEAFPPVIKQGAAAGVTKPEVFAAGSGNPTATTPATENITFPNPGEEIQRRCKTDGVTEAQVFAYAKEVKLAKKEQTELPQLSNEKLNGILAAWVASLPRMRLMKVD